MTRIKKKLNNKKLFQLTLKRFVNTAIPLNLESYSSFGKYWKASQEVISLPVIQHPQTLSNLMTSLFSPWAVHRPLCIASSHCLKPLPTCLTHLLDHSWYYLSLQTFSDWLCLSQHNIHYSHKININFLVPMIGNDDKGPTKVQGCVLSLWSNHGGRNGQTKDCIPANGHSSFLHVTTKDCIPANGHMWQLIFLGLSCFC